ADAGTARADRREGPVTEGQGGVDVRVVVPFYDEEAAVPAFFAELLPVLDRSGLRFEVIATDDGSTDGTFAALAAVHAADPRGKVVRCRRNFGQSAGLAAGFAHACGRVAVTMDGVLQNDPAGIPRLLAQLDEGYDVVSGWRRDRQGDLWTRILPSRIANGIISM